MVSSTLELRKDIKKTLSGVHERVFYRRASDRALYPYLTYSVSDIYEAKVLELDIWNIDVKDGTITTETIADNTQKTLEGYKLINENHSIILYYNEDRKWADDEDRRIQRINLSYEIRYYGKEQIIGKVKSGFSERTKENLPTGTGTFFKNFNVGVDTYESAKKTGKLIDATQSGGEFKAVATVRQIEADGVAGKTKGLELIDNWEISQSMSLLEATPETIKLVLGAADVGISSNGEYEIISDRSEIKDESYLDNLIYIGAITGSDTPVIIQIFSALSTDRLNIKTENKKEAVLGITVCGYYTEDDLDSPPYRIYYPEKKNVTTPVTNVKGGTYTESRSITLSTSTEEATIEYTTNGFEPTSKGTTYSTAITIDKSTVLKTKAFKSGIPDSSTLTETYIIETN